MGQTEKDPTAKKIDEREKNPNLRKPREMPDQSYMTPNISYKFEKQLKEMVFSLKKKKEQQKKSPYSNEKLKKKNPLHYLFVQLQKKEEDSNKVTNFERIKKT